MKIRMYAIYKRPQDYPNSWVLRGWEVRDGIKEPCPDLHPIVCSSRSEARGHIARLSPGATLIDSNDPDPSVEEVWM